MIDQLDNKLEKLKEENPETDFTNLDSVVNEDGIFKEIIQTETDFFQFYEKNKSYCLTLKLSLDGFTKYMFSSTGRQTYPLTMKIEQIDLSNFDRKLNIIVLALFPHFKNHPVHF